MLLLTGPPSVNWEGRKSLFSVAVDGEGLAALAKRSPQF